MKKSKNSKTTIIGEMIWNNNYTSRPRSEGVKEMNEGIIEKCLNEVSDVIYSFLEEQGGYSNGYLTYVDGVVNADDEEGGKLTWDTPKAKEELTDKGKDARGEVLYTTIQDVLKKHEVDAVTIRYKDEGYGVMCVEVVYIREIRKRVRLY